jgi:hypothetical protein
MGWAWWSAAIANRVRLMVGAGGGRNEFPGPRQCLRREASARHLLCQPAGNLELWRHGWYVSDAQLNGEAAG